MSFKLKEITQIVSEKIKGDIVSITFQKGGSSSTTHKVKNSYGDTYYFKENNNNHDLELQLTSKLSKMGVRLPEIIAAGRRWMIMSAANGVTLNELKDEKILSKAIQKAGKMVATINSVTLEGFGPLKSINIGQYLSYRDFYKELIKQIPENKQTVLISYVKRVKKSFLCHGDIYNSHIYSDKDGETITIIDLDDMLGASQFYDLAEYDISHKRDEKIWKWFTTGYGTVLPFPEHNSLDLLIEEYLILFESYLFTLNNHPEQTENLEAKKDKLKYLEKIIW